MTAANFARVGCALNIRRPKRSAGIEGDAERLEVLRNPHLIDTAFAEIPNKGGPNTIDPGPEDPNAFMVLVGALDELAAAGLLPPERRDGAEIIAWSSVHGISLLLARSPGMRANADEMITRVLDGILAALGLPAQRG